MKRAHRNAHVVLWIVLGPLALALLWLSVTGRPPTHIGPGGAESHADSIEVGADASGQPAAAAEDDR